MTGVLLRCMKQFVQLPDSMIINQKKKVINLVTQWYHIPVVAKLRTLRLLPQNKKTEESTKKVSTAIHNLQQLILAQGWIQQSEIERFLDDINKPYDICSSHALLLLQWCNLMDCVPTERVQLATQLWAHLHTCNIPLDLSHYSALLQIPLNNDTVVFIKIWMDEMKSAGFSPNSNIYEKCIEHYCQCGRMNSAKEYVEYFKKEYNCISETVYNSLIIGYSRSRNFAKVKEIVKLKEYQEMKPSINRYNALMCAYASVNDILKIQELIHNCYSDNISLPNDVIINVIYTLVRNHHMQHIDTMYQYLRMSVSFCSNEFTCILELIAIDQTDIVTNILLCIKNPDITKLALQNLVHHTRIVNKLLNTCAILEKQRVCQDALLHICFCSLRNDSDHLCLPLLRAYSSSNISGHKIKPHYFWPLLMKQAERYDFRGILDILDTMINEFKITPCIETIANYVLPFTFQTTLEMRETLIELGINPIIVNNAFLLFYLKANKIIPGIKYMKCYPGLYFYKTQEYELGKCLVITNDVPRFVYICSHLTDVLTESVFNSKVSQKTSFVSMDKVLNNFMNDYPYHVMLLKRLVTYLADKHKTLSPTTTYAIYKKLQTTGKHEIQSILESIIRKKGYPRKSEPARVNTEKCQKLKMQII